LSSPSDAPDADVARALTRFAIPRDGVLLVHSAFKGLARDGHRLTSVLAALRAHMAPGTLLMPTMSWRFVKPGGTFDERTTPSNTGALTELFRVSGATHRSLHPTHSCAGEGGRARDLLAEHHLGETPCWARSPFGLLAGADAWVLMLGISMDCCTLVHHVEESVAPDIYCRPADAADHYVLRDRDGGERELRLRRHKFLPRDYWQFQDMLADEGSLRVGAIDSSIVRAFRARDLVRVAEATLRARPDAVLARPGQRYRMM
jgi:aminoglycoside 3-N-acetyltransferase